MASVEVLDIWKRFGDVTVLKGVSLFVPDGDFVTLVGPSGCGKTTTLRIIAGLEVQDSGSVAIGDRVVDHVRPKNRDVALVFQSYALYPHMTVFDNMASPLVMRRLSAAQRIPLIGRLLPGSTDFLREIEEEVRKTAKSLQIESLLDRKPGQLSGGQRQRVALGRAIVRNPLAYLMDEPLSNLDAKLRVHMRAELAALHQRLGITFIYVTHDQAEALTMSSRVVVMMDGEIQQNATPKDIYTDPSNLKVAEFIGSPGINVLPGRVRGDGSVDMLGEVLRVDTGLADDKLVWVGLRPEDLAIEEASDDALAFRVGHIEYLGAEMFVHLWNERVDKPVIVRMDAAEEGRVSVNQVVRTRPKENRVLVFDAEGNRVRLRSAEKSGPLVRAGAIS
jgi:multiple sugar transport system ATP-binding protein